MRSLPFLFILLFASFSINAQDWYQEKWSELERAEVDGMVEDAQEILELIERRAKRKNDQDQMIKVFLFQSKFAMIKDENAQDTIILRIDEKIASSALPVTNLYHLVYAQLLIDYWESNQYRIRNRTAGVETGGFTTWDTDRFFIEITGQLEKALSQKEELASIKITDYPAIVKEWPASRSLRPTLLDAIAHEALAFYKKGFNFQSKAVDEYLITPENAFLDTQELLKIITTDAYSTQYKAQRLYAQLEQIHQELGNDAAYVNVLLERLEYNRNKLGYRTEFPAYEAQIKRLIQTYNNVPLGTLATHRLASYYYYRSNTGDGKLTNRELAIELSKAAIEKFPNSLGAERCRELLSIIYQPELFLQHQDNIIPDSTQHIVLKYKNVSRVNLYFIKADRALDSYKNRSDSLYRTIFKSAKRGNKIAIEKEVSLPQGDDTYEHSLKLELPGMSAGRYFVMATTGSDGESTLAVSELVTSNLSLFKTRDDNNLVVKVLDRTTGTPLQNIPVSQTLKKQGVYTTKNTDKHGLVKFRVNNVRDTRLLLAARDLDTIRASFYSYAYENNRLDVDESGREVKHFIYLDRAIYRPGQEVFYKVVTLSRYMGKTSVVKGEIFDLYVENASGDDIFETQAISNEYGSFSGSFVLPEDGPLGEFSLNVDSDEDSRFWDDVDDYDTGEHDFQVEEYKRPTFSAGFKPVTKAYKIGDSVRVTAFAKALLGSNITNATVNYSVARMAQLPWYRYQNLTSDKVILTQGTTTTNADGEAFINFKAIADDELSQKNEHPVYVFTIEVEIIDINGETRTATTSVNISKMPFDIELATNPQLDRAENEIQISLKTPNGKTASAYVQVELYKLPQAAQISYEDNLDQAEFHQDFTGDESREVNNRIKEPQSMLVFDKTIKIDTVRSIKIPIKKDWKNGSYLFKIKAAQEQERLNSTKIKLEKRISIWANYDLPLEATILKTVGKLKGNQVLLDLYTAASEIYAQVVAYDKERTISDETIRIPRGKTQLKFNLNKFKGKAAKFQITTLKNNAFETELIQVEKPIKPVAPTYNIETRTYRNKLYPGQEERWSFSIKGDKKVEMEAVASMYDMSLDQFLITRWDKPAFYDRHYEEYSPQRFSKLTPFKRSEAFINFNYARYHLPDLKFDQINFYGLRFNNFTRSYNQYLLNKMRILAPIKPVKGKFAGRVLDPDNEPVFGATIQVSGTNVFAQTDFDGNFVINAKPSDVLIISFPGYDQQSITVGKATTMVIILTTSLDEVVVAGYRTSNKARSNVAASTIVSEETEEFAISAGMYDDLNGDPDYLVRPNGNVIQRLQGQIAGLTIQDSTGQPGANSLVRLRGVASTNGNQEPLIIIDGIVVTEAVFRKLDPADIVETGVLKDSNATAIYGNRGANGVIIISTRAGVSVTDLVQQKIQLNSVQVRRDLKETAFFLPDLRTDEEGNINFTFNSPERLSQWRFRLLAHDQRGESVYLEKQAVTQKELSLVPNAPRFLREKDTVQFSTKISNLSDQPMNGVAILQLFDATTLKPVDSLMSNENSRQNFTATARGNTSISWTFTVPQGMPAVTYRVTAASNNFSDGEENVLPVLTNRELVTESRALWVRAGTTETVTMDNLINNTSSTLKNHQMTLEYTSNPSWYVIKSLPYLMEYPYECTEQTLSRLFANAIASKIVTSNPQIEKVFEAWEKNETLNSPLFKNQELKSIVIENTPWLKDAQSEKQQQKMLAKLFNKKRTASQIEKIIAILEEKQFSNGGFAWYGGSRPNAYITRLVASGITHLETLDAIGDYQKKLLSIRDKAISYLDQEWMERFQTYLKDHSTFKNYDFGVNYWHYQYARGVAPNNNNLLFKAKTTALKNAAQNYNSNLLYQQLLMAMVLQRNNDSKTAAKIMEALRQNAVTTSDKGMYWKENTNSYNWFSSDIETQALAIEAFTEITGDNKVIEELKVWLLHKKRATRWKSTKATALASYALLLQGSDWLQVKENTEIRWAGRPIPSSMLQDTEKEAGTGYLKVKLEAAEITREHATVKIQNKTTVTGYGALYWQYFEDLDQIKEDGAGELAVKKELFKKVNTERGERLERITAATPINIGDLVTVRLEIQVDQDMDFVHLKDLRASGFEPVDVLSKYRFQDGLGYYQSTKDVATHFFFDRINKGTYIFEYDVRANNAGNFSGGLAKIENMYAPEFSSHSEGTRVDIKE
ncbi:MAG: MG2 domain-containing protein [Nonlabens sp.]